MLGGPLARGLPASPNGRNILTRISQAVGRRRSGALPAPRQGIRHRHIHKRGLWVIPRSARVRSNSNPGLSSPMAWAASGAERPRR